MAKKRVADIIMETLVEEGIRDCFCVVGGGAMYLDNALALNRDIHTTFNQHEQACSMAAEAYARLSGRMAAVCVTSGPGATNAITGVMGAWVDSYPMIVLSGQVRYAISIEKSGLPLRYRGIQEFNIIESVKNMTKYAIMIKEPNTIKAEIKKAIHIAKCGRPGPVWLDIPQDIQSAMIDEDELTEYIDDEKEKDFPKEAFDEIIEMLRAAKRPCILGGAGLRCSNTVKEFRDLCTALKVPVIGAAWSADIMYDDNPYYYGMSGNIGPRTGNFIVQNSDFILSLGSSLGYKMTGFAQEYFAPKAKIVAVDIDSDEMAKPGLNLHKHYKADLKGFFKTALKYAVEIGADEEWINYCNKLRDRFSPFDPADNLPMGERVCSYYFWKVFRELESDDSICALGNNTANSAKLQIGVKTDAQRILTNKNCGSMGYDIPAAIGAAVASKKPVICLTGDGSIMMNLQELQTIKHNNLPVKVIVFSNDGYNAIRQTSKNFFDGLNFGCSAESGVSFPDFSDVARTFGFSYMHCHNNGGLKDSLKEFLAKEGNVLLEIDQRLDDPVTPKVMTRKNPDGSYATPALQDMYPFLDEDEYESLMLK